MLKFNIRLKQQASRLGSLIACCGYFFLTILPSTCLVAQIKPAILPGNIEGWPTLQGEVRINSNGKYFAYAIKGEPKNHTSTVFQSVSNNWKRVFQDLSFYNIVRWGNGDLGLAHKGDSVYMFRLGEDQSDRTIGGVKQVRTFPKSSNAVLCQTPENWTLFEFRESKSIELLNNVTRKSTMLKGIDQFFLVDKESVPVFKADSVMYAVNQDMSVDTICKLDRSDLLIGSMVFSSANGKYYALVSSRAAGTPKTALIEMGSGKQRTISEENLHGAENLFFNTFYLKLMQGDSTLVVAISPRLASPSLIDRKANPAAPVIWNYLDVKLAPNSVKTVNDPVRILYAYNIFSSKMFPIESDSLRSMQSYPQGEWVYLSDRLRSDDIGNTSRHPEKPMVATSVSTGHQLNTQVLPSKLISISPLNRNLLFVTDSSVAVFNAAANRSTGILARVNEIASQTNERIGRVEIAGWSENGDTVYYYYNYDIYMSSATGGFETRNLTSGVGAKKKIKFGLINEDKDVPINYREVKYLTALDKTTMDQGYYVIDLGNGKLPVKLENGKYNYLPRGVSVLNALGEAVVPRPVKARSADVYIIGRASSSVSPNLFLTKDFKTLTPLTDVSPESGFNWMRSELVDWKLPNGMTNFGILYKPEDFDSTRKYPVIVNIYENVSDGLNAYVKPDYLSCIINIPTYVSNGYLVFCPDIYRFSGNRFVDITKIVSSGIQELSRLSGVDTSRIGLSGGSFGGITAQFLVTQMNSFKAACIAAGTANSISGFNMVTSNGSKSDDYVLFQNGLGVSLYQDTKRYIDNSAILYADKISTPLLLMHGTKDDVCPFYDAAQFFNAVRYLNKKVWLLEYKDSGHGWSDNEEEDFSIRMRQYFDHYLMGRPAPDWMTKRSFDQWQRLRENLNVKIEERLPGTSGLK